MSEQSFMRLEGKVALITGGASGIGESTACLFAKEGARVTIGDINPERGEEVAERIRGQGGEAIFVEADVASSSDWQRIASRTVDAFGRLNVLFNNAGTVAYGNVLDQSEEEWDRVMTVDLKSVFLGCKHAIPEMLKVGGGSIINMGSIASFIARFERPSYCASKGGVLMLTKQVALDFAKQNIRVNAVCPASVDTPLLRAGMRQTGDYEAARQWHINSHPIKRIATAEEVARAVLYLASDESSFVTGTALMVDGGYTAE